MKSFNLLTIVLVVFLGLAAADPARVTQELSLNYNTAIPANFENSPVYLKEYFVPADWVNIIQDPEIRNEWDSLIHDRTKPGLVRILLHPYDKLNAIKIETALTAVGLPIDNSTYQVPFRLTESRSLYPETIEAVQVPVSPRLSMSHGLGKWNGLQIEYDDGGRKQETYNKMITSAQAEFAILASRIIQERLQGTAGQYFEIMPDRMVIGVKSPDGSLDLGETFRDLTSLKRVSEFSIPGFIHQHLQGGLLFALANGKTSSFDYLKEIEAPLRGRALAEFFALTGFVHSSPHSQNFLITTDHQFQAKGFKIRDLADLIPTFDSRQSAPKMAALFEQFQDAREALHKNLDGGKDYFAIRHSFIKGSNDMKALTHAQQLEVEKVLADEFTKTLAEISGVSVDLLNSIRTQNFSDVVTEYAITFFKRDSDIWRKVLTGLAQKRSAPKQDVLSRKLFSAEHADIEKHFKKIIVKKLTGEKISASQIQYLHSFLKPEILKRFNAQENEFLTSLIVATGDLPERRVGFLFSKLKNEKRDVFLEVLKKSPEGLQLEFLDHVKHYFENSDTTKDYFDRVYLKTALENMISHISNDKVPASQKLFEKLFLVNSAIDPTYISGINYHRLVGKLGSVPKAIKDYLLMKKQKDGQLSWTFDKLLEAPTATSIRLNKCVQLF